ncbi:MULTISPECIES: hypothetical protein [Legionella]|uniref:Major outer membrane protein n=1 Tax=Legionella drozanskii LLAP-1 TaxID=1212489 RepID=A0A0W0SW78_9GAMM|nr:MULTISPECIES: hypothetical protein [Legionella]KTC87630.1 hypothetical protein Ldro_1249 [Legionella drozanskii LLAP-1]PJE12438.1 MAG: hypothetical protein CK430_07510 [Legionella sp.]
MNIKSTVAGVIVATSMIAAGASEARTVCTTSTCGVWAVPSEFTGTGWHMVPCNTILPRATTWQQYSSGSYAPPVTGRGSLLLGL